MLSRWIAVLCFCINSLGWTASVLVPGSLSHEYKVSLKQVIEGSIPIQNEGDQVAKVRVTLSDYLFNSKGETTFPSIGTCSRSNGSWIKTNKTYFEVPPHSTYQFSYTMQIPEDTSLEGTYWSIFLIEPVEELFSPEDKKQSLGVQTIIRYGVQVISHIGTKGNYDLKILDKQLLKDKELTSFILEVENPGTLSQSPLVTLELVNSLGKKAGRFEAPKQRIFPTCSVSYKIDLSTIAQGKYKAMILLDDGDTAFFGAQYDLSLE